MSSLRDIVEDRQGDVHYARYGRPHSSEVPRYTRIGSGRVLGLNDGLRISRDDHDAAGTTITILPRGRQRGRDAKFGTMGQLSKRRPRRLKKQHVDGQEEFTKGIDFVRVGSSKKGSTASRREERNDWLGADYIERNQSMKTSGSSGESGEESSAESDVQVEDESLRERAQELSQKIRDDSSDIEAWLELVQLQPMILERAPRKQTTRPSNGQEEKAIAEVQLSILDRAYDAIKGGNLRIAFSRIRLASEHELWHRDMIKREWQRLLRLSRAGAYERKTNATDALQSHLTLFQAYVGYRLRVATVAEAIGVFADSISDLRDHFFGLSADCGHYVEHVYLDLLGSLLRLLDEAGFTERASAIVQAMCELTFFRPPSIALSPQKSFEDACDLLGKFWILEEPRIGERGAQGFAKVMNELKQNPELIFARRQRNLLETHKFDIGLLPSGLDSPNACDRFVALDKARSSMHTTSARTWDQPNWTTGEIDVDPHAFVFFDDILPFLFPIVADKAQTRLFQTSARHFGSASTAMPNYMAQDGFLDNPNEFSWPRCLHQESQKARSVIEGQIVAQEAHSALENPFCMQLPIASVSFHELFGANVGTTNKTWFGHWFKSNDSRYEYDRAVEFLDQSGKMPNNGIRTYALVNRLGLEAAHSSHKNVKKLARKLLSEHEGDIALWLAYAQYMRAFDDDTTARQVYQKILAQKPSERADNFAIAQVWDLWADLEWQAGHLGAVRLVLLRASQQHFGYDEDAASILLRSDVPQSIEYLRARRFHKERGEEFLGASETTQRALVTCEALLVYLFASEDQAFESASQVYESALSQRAERCDVSDFSAEQIALAYAKLIWRHTSRDVPSCCRSRRFNSEKVRQILANLSQRFPSSWPFTALHSALQMSVKFENGLRRSLEAKVHTISQSDDGLDLSLRKKEKHRHSLAVWLQYLFVELHLQANSINEYAVRALFERAITMHPQSTMLWLLYLNFENLLCGKAQRQRDAHHVKGKYPRRDEDHSGTDWARLNARDSSKMFRRRLKQAQRVFHRAVQFCPFDKDLYMRALSPPLRLSFTVDELCSIARAMDERELRTFVSLGAFLERQEQPSHSAAKRLEGSRFFESDHASSEE